MIKAMRSLGLDATVHGFRASLRTIGDEVLMIRPDFLEHQLGHRTKNANGNAYIRTTHLEARHAMMQRWSDYLDEIKLK
jgi:integrase